MLRALDRAQGILSRAVADETTLDGAVAFSSKRYPALVMANRAADLAAVEPVAADDLLHAIQAHFQDCGSRCLALAGAGLVDSRPMRAAAEAAGFKPRPWEALILQRYRPPQTPRDDVQVIPARAAFEQTARLFTAAGLEESNGDEQGARQRGDAVVEALDDPRFDLLLGRCNGEPVAAAGVVGLGQMGVIVELFTDPEHRGHGIGETMLDHLADLCHRARFEQVLVELPEAAAARSWLHRRGFDRFAELERWQEADAAAQGGSGQ